MKTAEAVWELLASVPLSSRTSDASTASWVLTFCLLFFFALLPLPRPHLPSLPSVLFQCVHLF